MSWSFSGLSNAARTISEGVVSAVIAPTSADGESSIDDADDQVSVEGEDVSAAIMNFGAAGFDSVLRGATSLAKQMPGALQATLESLDNVTGGGAAQSPTKSSTASADGWSYDDDDDIGIDDNVESDLKGVDIGAKSGSSDNVRGNDMSPQSVSALEAEANRLQRENQQLLAGLRQSKRTVLEEKSRADAFKAHAADLETRLIADSEKEAKRIEELTTQLHESESRLAREVEEREKDDDEWQKRIKVMQQDFRTRENAREDRLSELTDRVSYLERELSQERERRETAESRVAGLQVALGEERDKAADAKVREDRARAEVNEISREGFVESSELATVVEALEKQKRLTSEARTRESESKEELEGLRLELQMSNVEVDKLRQELAQSAIDASAFLEEQRAQIKLESNEATELLKSELAEVNRKIEMLHKSSNDVQISLEEAVERASKADGKLLDLQSSLKFAEERAHGLKLALESKEARVEELLAQISSNSTSVTATTTSSDDLEQSLLSLQQVEIKLKNSLTAAEDRSASAEGKVLELTSALLTQQEETKRLFSIAETNASNLEKSLLISESKIVELETALVVERKKCSDLEISLTLAEKKCAELEETLSVTDKRANKLRNSLTLADKKTDELENSLSVAEKKIDELEAALAIAEEGVMDKDSEHLMLRQELSKAQSEMEEAKEISKRSASESSLMASQLESLRAEVEHMLKLLNDERSIRAAAEAQVTSLSHSMKDGKLVEEERDSLRESYKRLQTSFDRIQGDYRTAFTREEEANDHIVELENEIAGLRRSLEAQAASGEEGKVAIELALEASNAAIAAKKALEQELSIARERNIEMKHDLDEISARSAEQATVVALLGNQASLAAERLLDAESRARAAAAAEEELSVLRADLLVRDAEISEAHTAISNLQLIVDENQAARLAVEEREQRVLSEKAMLMSRVSDLEREVNILRVQAQSAATTTTTTGNSGSNLLNDSLGSKQLAQSYTRIAQLQQQVHELKEALEDSKRHLFDSDSHSIDRRITGQLIVTFLTLQRRTGQNLGFGSRRAKDALSVVANVLSLSEPDRDAIGLLDEVEGPAEGPASAAVSTAVKTVGGLFSGFFGGGGEEDPQQKRQREVLARGDSLPKIDEEGKIDAPSVTLGAAFVQFLLAESSGLREAKDAENFDEDEDVDEDS